MPLANRALRVLTKAAPSTTAPANTTPKATTTGTKKPIRPAATHAHPNVAPIAASHDATATGHPHKNEYVSTPSSSCSGARILRPSSITTPLKKLAAKNQNNRSEERRVGKECRSRRETET